MEAAGIVASVQEEGKLQIAIVEIAKMPAQMLTSNNRAEILKSIVVLSSLVTSISDLPTFSLRDSLGPLFKQTWPSC